MGIHCWEDHWNVFRQVDSWWVDVWWKQLSMLHFNLPIITVTSLKINNSTAVLDPSYYRVYNGREYPADDRGNPKIELVSSSSSVPSPWHVTCVCKRVRTEDYSNMGYVEDDGLGGYQAPIVVKDCIMRLVIGDLSTYYASSISGVVQGRCLAYPQRAHRWTRNRIPDDEQRQRLGFDLSDIYDRWCSLERPSTSDFLMLWDIRIPQVDTRS